MPTCLQPRNSNAGHCRPLRLTNAMRLICEFLGILVAGPPATGTNVPVTLNLTPYNRTYNSFAVALSVTPVGFGTRTDTETSYATGTCPMSLDVVFNPSSYPATVQGLTATQTIQGRLI